MNPERFERYIRARSNNLCQYQRPNCTQTCDLIQQAYSTTQLEALHKDPASPDCWVCTCTNCANEGS